MVATVAAALSTAAAALAAAGGASSGVTDPPALGYGGYLAQTLLALVAVCALAVLVLRLLSRRLPSGARGMRVVARLTLEPRRTLYVVEVAGRYLVIGAGEAGTQLITELDPTRAAELEAPRRGTASPGLVDLVRRAVGGAKVDVGGGDASA